MKSCVLSIIVAFVISSLLLATPVLAQGKKESAKPLSPKKSEQPNIEKWAEAYKRDERPKILVLCGWATGAQQANDPGNVLWNVDTGGTCGSIRTSFRGVLNHPSADVEMVADDALRFAMERLQGTLNLRNEKEAVNLLMRNLTAELGIIIRLYDPKNGVPGRVIVESMMLDRARMAF